MNHETHHSVQHLQVQEEEVKKENKTNDQLGINLNSQQGGDKHQDPDREKELGDQDRLISPDEQTIC